MKYDFKGLAELGWLVAVAVGTVLMQLLLDFDPVKITDWRLWAISLGAASVRAAAGAIIAWLGKSRITV